MPTCSRAAPRAKTFDGIQRGTCWHFLPALSEYSLESEGLGGFQASSGSHPQDDLACCLLVGSTAS